MNVSRKNIIIHSIIVILTLSLGIKNLGFLLLSGLCILIFFLYLITENNFRIWFNRNLIYLIIGISFFAILGVRNPIFFRDFKFVLLWIFYLIVFNTLIKHNISRLLFSFYFLNYIILILYILLYLKIFENPYITEEIPEYKNYRVPGPALLSFYIIPYIYSVYNIKFDKKFIINFFIGLVAILLNGSLQNLVIFLISYAICYTSLTTFPQFSKRIVIILFILALSALGVVRFLSEKSLNKIAYIGNPMEAGTILTRLSDLTYMLNQTTNTSKQILIGSGFGVNSEVYRINTDSPSLSEFKTFLEIDNGFFYIYHRSGIIGLSLVIILFFLVFLKLKNAKAKFIFLSVFIITNLLSIHFWTYSLYSIFVAMFIKQNIPYTLPDDEKKG